MRVAVGGVGAHPHQLQQFPHRLRAGGAGQVQMDFHQFGDGRPHRHPRVEGGERVLENDLHVAAQLPQPAPVGGDDVDGFPPARRPGRRPGTRLGSPPVPVRRPPPGRGRRPAAVAGTPPRRWVPPSATRSGRWSICRSRIRRPGPRCVRTGCRTTPRPPPTPPPGCG